jgi:hypothetical protein
MTDGRNRGNGNREKQTITISPLHRFSDSPIRICKDWFPSDEEIRELESLEIPEKIKKEVCQEVAEKMGISVEEVRELMEKAESAIPGRKFKK